MLMLRCAFMKQKGLIPLLDREGKTVISPISTLTERIDDYIILHIPVGVTGGVK